MPHLSGYPQSFVAQPRHLYREVRQPKPEEVGPAPDADVDFEITDPESEIQPSPEAQARAQYKKDRAASEYWEEAARSVADENKGDYRSGRKDVPKAPHELAADRRKAHTQAELARVKAEIAAAKSGGRVGKMERPATPSSALPKAKLPRLAEMTSARITPPKAGLLDTVKGWFRR